MILKLVAFILIGIYLSFQISADDHSLKFKPVINLKVAKIMADACEQDQKKKWL